LLSLLREQTRRDFPILEDLADFRAHRRRDWNRGQIRKYIDRQIEIWKLLPEERPKTIDLLYSDEELMAEIIKIMPEEIKQHITLEKIARFKISAISFLDHAKLICDRDEVKLRLVYDKKLIGLYGNIPFPRGTMFVPITATFNREYIQTPLDNLYVPPRPVFCEISKGSVSISYL
jgi:hypothetical protein